MELLNVNTRRRKNQYHRVNVLTSQPCNELGIIESKYSMTRLRMRYVLTSYSHIFRYHLFLVTVVTILSIGSILIVIYSDEDTQYLNHLLNNVNDLNEHREQFTIMTEGCSIPSMKPFDESIKEFIGYPDDMETCRNLNKTLLKHNKTHIWIQKKMVPQYIEQSFNNATITCCYKAFYRPESVENIFVYSDNRVKYKECLYFSNAVEVKDEFVRVTCNISNTDMNKTIYDDFFLFATKKTFTIHNNKREIPKNKPAYNIIVMGIDGVSRLNLFRTMPKTVEFLKNRSAVDFAGYNKVGDNTFPNMISMLLGITTEELTKTCLPYKGATFDNCPFIWEWFKQAGYYTAFAEDSSRMANFNYFRAGFHRTPTDYYIQTFINEAEVKASENGPSMCINDRYFYKVLLDYEEDIIMTLKSSKLFGFFWEVTMSHDFLNYPMVMDDSYVTFLKKLEAANYLDETILFFVSDHGIRWGPFRSTKQGRLEERLPFLFILVPPAFRETYSVAFNNLKLNSKRLTTPFNLHSTLFDLVDLNNIKNEKIASRSMQSYSFDRNISLFLLIPDNRTCQIAGISDHWCTCHKFVTISNTSVEAIEASAHLMTYLNNLLAEYPKCSQLTFAEIIEANEMVTTETNVKTMGLHIFMITVRTKPLDGFFEATLHRIDSQWSLAGTVSRVNLYGNQSHCVEDNFLKPYCNCML